MLTICTACGTQFRVNTAQLRAVHGLVRCSRCQSVFDAFETLKEELGPPAADSTPPAAEDLAALAQEIGTPETDAPLSIPPSLIVRPMDPEDADLRLDAAESKPSTDELLADVWGEAATEESSDPGVVATQAPEPLLIEDRLPKPPEQALDQTLYRHKQLPPREAQNAVAERQHRKFKVWTWGAVVLALLLAVQLVNAHRQAMSHAVIIGPAISGLYAAFGQPLAATTAPDIWQISGTNVTSDPDTPGALSITGTLENRAAFAQSWPALRVELTDRYGDVLRARDFSAGQYLPAGRSATWLGAGMAAQFRVDVVDPGADAVGFTVMPCIEVQAERECHSSNSGND